MLVGLRTQNSLRATWQAGCVGEVRNEAKTKLTSKVKDIVEQNLLVLYQQNKYTNRQCWCVMCGRDSAGVHTTHHCMCEERGLHMGLISGETAEASWCGPITMEVCVWGAVCQEGNVSSAEGEPCICRAEARWETKGAANQMSGSRGGTQIDNKAIRDVLEKQRPADHTDRMESGWCSETAGVCFLASAGSLAPPLRAPALFHFIPCTFFYAGVVFSCLPPGSVEVFDPAGSQGTVP